MRRTPLPRERRDVRAPRRSSALILFGAVCLILYLWAAASRANALFENWPLLLILLALAVGPLVSPLRGALGVFFLIPFFGNFPGGRYMEFLNIPLAAGVVGLTLRARREDLPPPRGRLWLGAFLFVAAATLALIPSLEGVLPRLFQIASLPEAVVETLTARETDPLYSVSSLILLALAAAWAYALAWASSGTDFARKALRCVAVAFVAVVALGALDLHGVLDLPAVLRKIDPRSVGYEGFQSIFWNPSWFSWYFVMAFGLVMGLLWVEQPPVKLALGAVLAIAYVYSFGNPQRGGFLALHAALAAALAYLLATSRARKRNLALAAAVLFGAVALAAIAFRSVPKPESRGSAWTRLTGGLEKTDTIRKNLAVTAWRMTSEFPLFGVGEGAFTWRWADYAPKEDPPRPDPAFGDAHNTFLQILATRGVFGLASYLVLLLFLGRRILHAARGSGPERGIVLGLAFSLTAFLTYSFVQHMFYLQSIQALFWGIVALAAIVSPDEGEARVLGRRGWTLLAAGLVALALQLSLAWPQLARGAARVRLEPHGFSGLEIWGSEGPMRWSSRRGTLCVYPTGLVMRLQVLAAHPDLAVNPVTVSIRVERRLLDRFSLDKPVANERTLFLPQSEGPVREKALVPFGQCVEAAHPLRLTIETSRIWSPFSVGQSGDTRHLGLAVFEPSFSPGPQARANE